MNQDRELLHARLNAETGRLGWAELQRHFARGAVIKVTAGMDLVEVAMAIAEDNREAVAIWMEAGRIARAGTDDAIAWNDRAAQFWAVVAAPWVLVQEIISDHQPGTA
jgi:hypothetical protein